MYIFLRCHFFFWIFFNPKFFLGVFYNTFASKNKTFWTPMDRFLYWTVADGRVAFFTQKNQTKIRTCRILLFYLFIFLYWLSNFKVVLVCLNMLKFSFRRKNKGFRSNFLNFPFFVIESVRCNRIICFNKIFQCERIQIFILKTRSRVIDFSIKEI